MRVRVRLTAGLCFGLLAATADAAVREMNVTTGDGKRHFYLAEAERPHSGPRPLVLVLHGHGGSAAQAMGLRPLIPSPLSAWVTIAQRDDILVAALDGEKGGDPFQGWNDCRTDAYGNPKTDDVAFARTVIHRFVDSGQADPARIYVMGMSNGGMMAYRLALQLPEIAAFAAVSAAMASASQCPEKPSAQVGALIVNGDADPLVPYAGGQVHFGNSAPRGGVLPTPDVFAQWAGAHGLQPAAAASKTLPPQLRRDDTHGEVAYFGASPAASPVTLVHVVGGGHAEPSLRHRYRALYLSRAGKQSSIFESADFAWDFFRNKSRPQP